MKDNYYISLLIPGMACQGDTLETKSLGGSETAGVCVARELSKLGHTVKVFSNCETPGDYNGVQYYPAAHFQDCLERVPGDVLISQRTPDPFISRSVHKLHLLWCHDLALGRAVNSFRSVCWNVDKFMVVSDWMKNQYIEAMGIPADMVYPTRNGIDLFRFPRVDLVQKNRKRLVYAARPERGLDVMLDRIFPALLEKDPEFELALFGYDNPVEHLRGFYEGLAAKSNQFGDKVRFMGHLTKQELYQAYASFGIYAYPTPSPQFSDFREVSCISAMEAMASGMPIVTSNMGALAETIPEGAGVLVDGDPMSDEYRDTFVNAVLDFAHNDDSYKAAAAVGMEHAESLSWAGVAEDWSEKIGEWLFERNSDRVRLAHHFYRRNDVFATLEALKGQKGSVANVLRMKVKDEYDFALCGDPDVLKAHYLQGGVETDERLSANSVSPEELIETREPRFLSIRDYLAGQEGLGRFLDYGCGHGWSTSYLGSQLGGHWVGVDLDPGAVKWARTYTDSLKDEKFTSEFVEGDHTVDLGDEPFDAALVSEVLEHCPDPYAVINAVEKNVKVGGPVVVTVPFGPSEFGTPNWDKFRGHLWEFDIHDLRDIFGDKPDYAASSGPIYPNPVTGEMIGFHFVTYKADHRPVGRINMKRKLRLQRPRETVSASIIAGPNAEQTLGWCLASIKPFVDEIIIADTGLDDIGRMIAERYGAKFVKGSNPLEAGFETPRNEALDACSMDWVLWIDTDEKLLGGPNLSKYLRFNLWHGLSIMQHHFSVDAGFTPDMPVRLFRRGPCMREGKLQGKVMRHYGCLTPSTLVTTNPGVECISDINVGDRVRTHDGSYGEVDKVWEYDVKDELLRIKAVGMPDPLEITKDHELYVIKTEKCWYDKTYNVRCKPTCVKVDKCSRKNFGSDLQKIRAVDVEVGDYLVYPVDYEVLDKIHVCFSDWANGHADSNHAPLWKLKGDVWESTVFQQIRRVKDKVDLAGGLLRLAGYYVSDGCVTRPGRLMFYFGAHEEGYANDVVDIAEGLGFVGKWESKKQASVWNSNPDGDNIIVVEVCGRPLTEWLVGEFGAGSHHKKAPMWVMKLALDKQFDFLMGLWRGDGTVKGSLVRYATVGRDLAYQVHELLLRQGIMANVSYGKAAKAYYTFARIRGKKFLGWDMPPANRNVSPESWSDGTYVYQRVTNIELFDYEGKVYDLRVPGNHSFVFGHVAGSNCIHEHPELALNEGPGDVLVLPDVQIAHTGYLDEPIRRQRFLRNSPLLAKDCETYPDRLLQKHFIMRDNMLLCSYEGTQNGGRITDNMRQMAEETVALYREHFLGQAKYANIDSLPYYTQALQILGRGVDVSYMVAASRDGVGDNLNNGTPVLARFENYEEAQIEISNLLKAKFDPLQPEMW